MLLNPFLAILLTSKFKISVLDIILHPQTDPERVQTTVWLS